MPAEPVVYTFTHFDCKKVAPEIPESLIGRTGSWDIRDLVKLTGKDENGLRAHQSRNQWTPDDITTIPYVVGRHGEFEFRMKMIENLIGKRGHTSRDPLAKVVLALCQYASNTYGRNIMRRALFGLGMIPTKKKSKVS
jgi:hypothetical protein